MAPNVSNNMKTLIAKKDRLLARMKVTYEMTLKLPERSDIFLARAEKLEDTYKEFDSILLQMYEINSTLESDEVVKLEEDTALFEEYYFSIKAAADNILLNKRKDTDSHDTKTPKAESAGEIGNTSERHKLPRIQIEPFSGKYEEFNSFISLFNTLIHNTNLSDIEKFSYLRSLLRYPASQTLDSIDFRGDNYMLAYEKLVERYSNPRIIASYHLNKILKFKPLAEDNANNFRLFLDTFDDNYQAIKALKLNDLGDFFMLHLGLKAVDKHTRKLFESQYSGSEIPNFKSLCDFIKTQYRVAELCTESFAKPSNSATNNRKSKSLSESKCNSFFSKSVDKNNCIQCPLCKSSHKIFVCPKFLGLDVSQRYKILKENNRCFSCTGTHRIKDCKSKKVCSICHKRSHHTLLHKMSEDVSHSVSSPVSAEISEEPVDNSAVVNSLSCHTIKNSQVLLGTALAKIRSHYGHYVTCRILIDSCSEISFITSKLASALALPRTKAFLNPAGVGEVSLPASKMDVDCFITSNVDPSSSYRFSARVTPLIVKAAPSIQLPSDIKKRFSSLVLADPDFDKPGPVDILIAADVYSQIVSDPPSYIKGTPSAIHTSLGWVIFGGVNSIPKSSAISCFTLSSLHEDMKKFWETEEVDIVIPEKPEDKYCEDFFKETVQRDSEGRYIVSLPFNPEIPLRLGSTREIALQRLKKLEIRFRRSPQYFEMYSNQMKGYIESDHIRLTEKPSNYVLTHHGVHKDSSTTQLRVVFNGSEEAPGFRSLNKHLLTGPNLSTDIGKIIDNFRLFPVALSCDIKQMFRCIRLNPNDRKYVHLFWRFDPTQPVSEYELVTLPFGLVCSPYEAQRVVKEHFKREGHKFPRAAECEKDIYMDNIVTGAYSVEDALELYTQLNEFFSSAGFLLRKFSSNNPYVLSEIPEEHLEKPLPLHEHGSMIKVLGLQWNPLSDCLCYNVYIDNPVFSKRGLLSLAARIYDINGYLSPVVFWIKCLIQRLWLLHLDWDDALPADIQANWRSFLEELPSISDIQIPRYVLSSSYVSLQLVAFADASEKGFGCLVYLRMEHPHKEAETHLLRAKSKVAPLKTLSIPRLELNAAHLLSKVLRSLTELKGRLKISQVVCFSDSKNVLGWLQTPPYQLKIYVANRVVQILESTSPSEWNYIPSKLNPADCLSRGLTPRQLKTHSLYWHGPDFLRLPISEWPHSVIDSPVELPELKPISLMSQNPRNDLLIYFDKFSSFLRLQRVMAYVIRYQNILLKKVSHSGPLSSEELNFALYTYIKLVQREFFREELSLLNQGKPILGNLRKLSPFLSPDGLIMVGGRLKNAPIPKFMKHPILIPKNSHLASILCDFYHLYSLHGGPQLVQSLIQRRYWIPSLRGLIRKRIFNCIVCYKAKAKPHYPMMSDLPACRVSQARPFQEVGIDFGGPFLFKESKRRSAAKSKCWIALFVCMCTKAVHLELVTSLSTHAFFACLERFISRRGLPSCIHSDRGTNFVGASRKLRELKEFLSGNDSSVSDFLSKFQIDWKFIPPASPHFGGLWEAAIKATKRHLLAVIQDHALTFEEFNTLLSKIEAALNSRPLCSVSNHPSDNLDYLSPGHFLIGQPLLALPTTSEVSIFPLTTRWELLCSSFRNFWKRWYHEYLQSLIPRSKWTNSRKNIEVGTLIILKEKHPSPLHWTLGRVIEVLPGADGVVRVVKIKTSTTTLVRPVHKLIPLPDGRDIN